MGNGVKVNPADGSVTASGTISGSSISAPSASSYKVGNRTLQDIIDQVVVGLNDGAARPLPPYLHFLQFDDTYIADARAWYADHDHLPSSAACSVIRKGNLLGRNYDNPYDESAAFVVAMSAKEGRHASVGTANVHSDLTEKFVCSGVYSPLYRVLPGRVVDGINDAGVFCEVNVIPRDPAKDPTQGIDPETGIDRQLHCFEVVRHVLDNFDDAAEAAEYISANYYIPEGSPDSYHWMIADANGTYIVEDGEAHAVTGGVSAAMTNHRLFSTDEFGTGYARLQALTSEMDIEGALAAAKFTNAYAEGWPWPDEFAGAEDDDGRIPHDATARLTAWATAHVTPHLDPVTRKPAARDGSCWQTVHSAIYDLAAKTMRVAVQEDAVRFEFALPAAGGGGGGGVDPSAFDYVLKVNPETGNIYYDDGQN